ncbi:MAG: N-acetylmuramoyl-L-alanine amidase [Muribaculaceae bacterium]|nr:N-acetylmuramoyl-L-alanine amidase [Muribaculaceae bacterium]
MKPFVILDNGHGASTPGKSSPDGLYHEWESTRRIAAAIADGLQARGIDHHLLVPEATDVPLRTRTAAVNALTATHPDAILISIHSNAAGDGSRWSDARGWCAFVAPKASQNSCRLARLLTTEAHRHGLEGNRLTPAEGFWRASLAMVRDTHCPAVLTENLFHDNRSDVKILLSDSGIATIARLHIDAIAKYYSLP